MIRPIDERERSLAGKTVLVTGAGGFIGSHLTERLLAAGCKVRGLVRYNSRNDAGFLEGTDHPNLEIVRGDICDEPLLRKYTLDCELVFHLAALIAIPYSYHAPSSYVDVNVRGTLNLLNACRDNGVGRIFQTSTSEVYGSAQRVPMDEDHPLHPQSPYAATKVAADQLALSYYCSFDTRVTVIRPFNTYGPRQSTRALLPTICLQALRGSSLQLGNTSSQRDMTFVDDTCAGFLYAATSPETIGEVVNLGVGQTHGVLEIVDSVATILGKSLVVETDASRLRPAKSEVTRLLSDNQKAKRMMNWSPSVSLTTGLRALLDWLKEQPYRPGVSYAL